MFTLRKGWHVQSRSVSTVSSIAASPLRPPTYHASSLATTHVPSLEKACCHFSTSVYTVLFGAACLLFRCFLEKYLMSVVGSTSIVINTFYGCTLLLLTRLGVLSYGWGGGVSRVPERDATHNKNSRHASMLYICSARHGIGESIDIPCSEAGKTRGSLLARCSIVLPPCYPSWEMASCGWGYLGVCLDTMNLCDISHSSGEALASVRGFTEKALSKLICFLPGST